MSLRKAQFRQTKRDSQGYYTLNAAKIPTIRIIKMHWQLKCYPMIICELQSNNFFLQFPFQKGKN